MSKLTGNTTTSIIILIQHADQAKEASKKYKCMQTNMENNVEEVSMQLIQ